MRQVPTQQVVASLATPRDNHKWVNFPGKIGAGIAESDFGVAPAITTALHDAVERGFFGYLPDHTHDDLVASFADFTADRYGWSIPCESVRVVEAVQSGFEATIHHFSRPESAVIVPTPAYTPFLRRPARVGRRVVEVPMLREGGRYRMDLEAIAEAFRAGAGLLVLCNPHNPTGTVLDLDELRAIADVVDRYGGRVFSDEVWAPVVFDGPHIPYASISDSAAAHTITATAPSKGWNLSGLKCAQLVLTNRDDRARWDELGLVPPHSNSILGVVAATAAYTEGGPWLDSVVARFAANRALLGRLLDERLPGVWPIQPEATYLAWLDFTGFEVEGSPCAFLLDRAGVVLNEGSSCGDSWMSFARFNFAMPATHLVRAVDATARSLKR